MEKQKKRNINSNYCDASCPDVGNSTGNGNKTKPTTKDQTTVILFKLLCCPLAKRTILAALEHKVFLLTWFPYL